ncbi:hypothetical protein [Kingella potus]|uniref:hypothetical protein n=1 Tax=Kingella potus TaxID=265175 RepID=UPI001FD1B9E7|nr:hypothetical protein [Kingella potus]UOP00754.1 hypothetical protein LVJ84_13440 [Kingella potus]
MRGLRHTPYFNGRGRLKTANGISDAWNHASDGFVFCFANHSTIPQPRAPLGRYTLLQRQRPSENLKL